MFGRHVSAPPSHQHMMLDLVQEDSLPLPPYPSLSPLQKKGGTNAVKLSTAGTRSVVDTQTPFLLTHHHLEGKKETYLLPILAHKGESACHFMVLSSNGVVITGTSCRRLGWPLRKGARNIWSGYLRPDPVMVVEKRDDQSVECVRSKPSYPICWLPNPLNNLGKATCPSIIVPDIVEAPISACTIIRLIISPECPCLDARA